ncbi:MAG TPA: hypothetical protein VIK77_12925 [Tissierellaceae bacterium]
MDTNNHEIKQDDIEKQREKTFEYLFRCGIKQGGISILNTVILLAIMFTVDWCGARFGCH